MKITEIENKDLKIEKIAMSCDKTITDTKGKTVAYPLMTTSSFILITGASGSGKSNLMISLIPIAELVIIHCVVLLILTVKVHHNA